MTPEELSRQLREGSGGFLRQRRVVVGLSLIASTAMGVIAPYQMGLVRHIPEPPLPWLDADRVDAAPEAYGMLSTPDAILGLVSYAGTMSLAAMGGEDRAATQPWIPLSLAAKVAADTIMAAKLTADQWTKHRAFCSWCLLASAATFATVPYVVPETRAALARLRGAPGTA